MQFAASKFLIVQSPSLGLKLEDSSFIFNNGAQMKLWNADLKMIDNNFIGSGTVEVDTGNNTLRVSAQIAASTFRRVSLLFTGKPTRNKRITLRNNVFLDGANFSTTIDPQHCDAGAATGQAAGCDPRAACTEPFPGDVHCRCTKPLRYKAGDVQDGSKCELDGKLLGIFQPAKTVKARVRKPSNTTVLFAVQARSERPFSPSILIQYKQSTTKRFLHVEASSSDVEFAMSPAKSELKKEFNLTVLGLAVDWPDSEKRTASIVVNADEAKAQSLLVEIDLEPYGSCMHTYVHLEGARVTLGEKVQGEIALQIVARDTDGHPILSTRCEFRVQLAHKEEMPTSIDLDVVRDGINGSKYSSVVPLNDLRVGLYEVMVEMLRGPDRTCGAWNDAGNSSVAACTPEKWKRARNSFVVTCAPGFLSLADFLLL